MQIIRQFCTAEELAQLVELWKAGKGWEARGSYIFTPCFDPPKDLIEKARPYLPPSDSAPYSDSFFIHYVEQKALTVHTDFRSVVRINVLVIKADEGGQFIVNGEVLSMEAGDAVVFNPNTEPHGVTQLHKGQRLVWSLGRTKSEINPVKILTRKLRRAARKAHKPPPGFL